MYRVGALLPPQGWRLDPLRSFLVHFQTSGDVVSALSIFDPRKVPCVDSDDLSCYGQDSVSTLLTHYGIERSAETLDGELRNSEEATISPDNSREWKTFRRYMSKQPKDNLQLQDLK